VVGPAREAQRHRSQHASPKPRPPTHRKRGVPSAWFAMTLLQHTCRAPAQKHGLLGVLDSAVEAQPSAASWLEYSHHLLQRPRPISEEL